MSDQDDKPLPVTDDQVKITVTLYYPESQDTETTTSSVSSSTGGMMACMFSVGCFMEGSKHTMITSSHKFA